MGSFLNSDQKRTEVGSPADGSQTVLHLANKWHVHREEPNFPMVGMTRLYSFATIHRQRPWNYLPQQVCSCVPQRKKLAWRSPPGGRCHELSSG